MTNKDIFDLIKNAATIQSTSDSYDKLCCFVNAMQWGQYFPISDEDIRKGMEFAKAQEKSKLKMLYLGTGAPPAVEQGSDAAIEIKYARCLQSLLDYKHTYEKQHNCVIHQVRDTLNRL